MTAETLQQHTKHTVALLCLQPDLQDLISVSKGTEV